MKVIRLIGMIALPLLLGACASNVAIVKNMDAEHTGCEQDQIEVRRLDQSYAGISRYETQACGITHNYVCAKWYNRTMNVLYAYAAIEHNALTVPAFGRCARERR